MKVHITIPDSLYEKYVIKWGVPTIYRKFSEAIEFMKDVEKNDRPFLVCGDERRAIEAVFQTTIDNAQKLHKLVVNLSKVTIGDVRIPFTSDELARIQMQASFHGRTAEKYIEETLTEIKQRFMEEV